VRPQLLHHRITAADIGVGSGEMDGDGHGVTITGPPPRGEGIARARRFVRISLP
jgi:hypothetical protein